MFVCYYRTMILFCTVLFYFFFFKSCVLPLAILSFWTSSMPSAALTSNPLLRLPGFGLPPFLSLLQRPIYSSNFPVLDFLRASLCSNVQSMLPASRFWTFSVPSATLTSNSRFQLPGFGLLPCLTLLQRPIHASGFPVLDFLRASLCSNVQSTPPASRFWTSSVPLSALTSNPRLRSPDFGLLPCLPLL